jgi:CheY-like chemotaxis protein
MRLGESCRVLIVEDNADALESLRLQMELWATRSHGAQRRGGARESGRARPQIVLCDIGLPGMDGYKLVAALRKKLGGSPVSSLR